MRLAMPVSAALAFAVSLSANAATPLAVGEKQPGAVSLKKLDLPVGQRTFAGDVGALLHTRVNLIATLRTPDRSRVSIVFDHLRLERARQLGVISLKPWPLQCTPVQPELLPPLRLPRDVG